MGVGRVDDDGVQRADHEPILTTPGPVATVGSRPPLAGIRPPGLWPAARVSHDHRHVLHPPTRPHPMTAPRLGSLRWEPAASGRNLLGGRVAAALPKLPGPVWVAEIDPELADTAAFTEAYGVPLDASANCVVVAARRAGVTTLAACLVLATTRADVNGLVRRHLDARKASFAPQDVAVAESGMAYGGIPPIGLPEAWPVLVDAAVAAADWVVVGSGIRGSKIALPGRAAAPLPGAVVLEGLGRPLTLDPAPARTGDPAPERAPDDLDVGWGERTAASGGARRCLEDRPPHWGSD